MDKRMVWRCRFKTRWTVIDIIRKGLESTHPREILIPSFFQKLFCVAANIDSKFYADLLNLLRSQYALIPAIFPIAEYCQI